MGWDKGKYYTRSRKVRGRVVREYIGGGRFGLAVAGIDAIERVQRLGERKRLLNEKAELETFDDRIAMIVESAEAIAHATLLVAGYHEHRGQWRKRRE